VSRHTCHVEAVLPVEREQTFVVDTRPDAEKPLVCAFLEPPEKLGDDLRRVDVGRDLEVGPPAHRFVARPVGIDVADEPPVALEQPHVPLWIDGRRRQPGTELLGSRVRLAEDRELVRVHQLEDRVEVVVARRAQAHAKAFSKVTVSVSTCMPARS
jgi:hypothetical protein